ncbi:MAG TPA: right-handed parallel beta-helix repeat-containing protein [Streptosporangiaceae bacterium]|nr:right-handed parallel beta-helix repeat-containing protein [Streptosporangiaceae bacterium]
MRRFVMAMAASVAVLTPGVMALGTGAASASPTRAIYVSPHGKPFKSGRSCLTARYSSINKAIRAAPPGGTVIVCRGTYFTQAVVAKPLRLIGLAGAVINAKGQKPLPGLPVPGGSGVVVIATRHVLVRGFVVVNAKFDGILVARSAFVEVSHNILANNGDNNSGVGVDFNGTSFSLADHNLAKFNSGGGFLVADDLGRTGHDAIAWNEATRNPGGCGVIIAGHSTAGVTSNLVAHNLLTYNGTSKKSPGAGVVIATEVPRETVADNTVLDNVIYGNGLAGVTIHAHLRNQHMNGNQIVGNDIGTNNTVGDPIDLGPPVINKPDLRTTGILVGSSSRIKVLISHNYIHDNFYGIFIEGRVHATLIKNRFRRVVVPVRFV